MLPPRAMRPEDRLRYAPQYLRRALHIIAVGLTDQPAAPGEPPLLAVARQLAAEHPEDAGDLRQRRVMERAFAKLLFAALARADDAAFRPLLAAPAARTTSALPAAPVNVIPFPAAKAPTR